MSNLKPELRIKKLNILQEKAVDAIATNGFNGMVILPTGTGKSFVQFKTILKALETKLISKGDEVWILAEEVLARKNTYFKEEIPKFNKTIGVDLLSLVSLKFYSHKIAPKYYKQCREGTKIKPKLILIDECECIFTALGIKSLKFKDIGVPLVGYTATDGATMQVFRDEVEMPTYQSDKLTKQKKISAYINKGQIGQIYMPIVFEVSLQWAIDEGLLSPFVTTIIKHRLSTNSIKYPTTITKGNNKKEPWIDSEEKYWNYWLELSNKRSVDYGFRAIIKSRLLPRFLFTLPSKVEIGKKLVKLCEANNRKTLVFSSQLDWINKFVTHIARKENTVELLRDLNSGKILTVGSSKRLSRGVTIKGLDTVIIFIHGKSNSKFTQILGRLLRYEYKKIGKLILIYVGNTYEEKWLREMLKQRNYKGKLITQINLNVTKTINSNSLL